MNILSRLKDQVTQYIDVHVKLFKLNFIGRSAGLLSYLLFALVCIFILFCIALFLGFGVVEALIAFGFSKLASFFITIGVYVLLLIIIVALRRKITRFFGGEIIKVLTEGDDEERDE